MNCAGSDLSTSRERAGYAQVRKLLGSVQTRGTCGPDLRRTSGQETPTMGSRSAPTAASGTAGLAGATGAIRS